MCRRLVHQIHRLLPNFKMTYMELLEQLQVCSNETLQQEVTVYDIAEDEFVPVSETHYTNEDSQVLDPKHLYFAF